MALAERILPSVIEPEKRTDRCGDKRFRHFAMANNPLDFKRI